MAIKKTLSTSKWNTRKLVGFGILFAGSLLLCYTGKVTGVETFQLWIWLFGLYIFGNVSTKIVTPGMIGRLKTRLKISSKNKK